MDFKTYIESAKKHVDRSNMLWLQVNRYILHILEEGEQMGMTLDQIAEHLEQAAGKAEKNEPVSIGNIRVAAKQIKAREELVLI